MNAPFKIPVSVLVVVHAPDGRVLLLERADQPGFWQSVTGSREAADATLADTAAREVGEEAGLQLPASAFTDWRHVNRYPIYRHWRHRYAPGTTHNEEHVFGLLVDVFTPALAPAEHRAARWLPWREAADACFSWTNAQAIRRLAGRLAAAPGASPALTTLPP